MSATENWRSVVGFPDYRVSDQGRVVSYRRKTPRELVGGRNQRGYRLVQMRATDGSITARTVHRIVADAFLGPCPEGLQTRHLDGDKDNCSVSNLAFGTPGQNMLDQVRHGVHNMARKTHCPKDHPYSEDNTLRYRGKRICRTCQRDRRTNAALRAANVPTSAAA